MDQAHVYSQVRTSSDADSDLQSENYEHDKQIPSRDTSTKLKYLATFLGGVLFGIVLSSGLKPLNWTRPQHVAQMKTHVNENIGTADQELFRDGTIVIAQIDGVEVEGTQCGGSWEDAKRLGCHYDVMASRWYSEECFDEEVLLEFLAEPLVNYTWFSDREHTQQVSEQLALSGEFDKLYPLNDYHIAHCLYLWRRLHHAVMTTRPLDDDLFSYEHTMHCTRMILAWRSPYEQMSLTIAHSGLPFCRKRPLGLLGED